MRLHGRITVGGLFLAIASAALAAAGQAQDAASPCVGGVAYRQFDFWVGEWDVFTPDSQLAGTNRIVRTLGGCLLEEHWRSLGGGEGKSIDYYDPATDTWVQTWVDGEGGITAVEGALAEGAMRFHGEHVYHDGRREAYRMTFTPCADGTVR